MSDQLDWKDTWPTEAGSYWFYGYRYRSANIPELILVDCFAVSNGFCFVGKGQFMYEGEGCRGKFARMNLPPTPDVQFRYNRTSSKRTACTVARLYLKSIGVDVEERDLTLVQSGGTLIHDWVFSLPNGYTVTLSNSDPPMDPVYKKDDNT